MRKQIWTVVVLCAIALMCCTPRSVAQDVPPIPSAESHHSKIPTQDSDVYRYGLGGVVLLLIGGGLMQLSSRRRTPPDSRLPKRRRRREPPITASEPKRPGSAPSVAAVPGGVQPRNPEGTMTVGEGRFARLRAFSGGALPVRVRKIARGVPFAKPRGAKLRKGSTATPGDPSSAVERLRRDVRGWTDRD
jgi:hypothetical protein